MCLNWLTPKTEIPKKVKCYVVVKKKFLELMPKDKVDKLKKGMTIMDGQRVKGKIVCLPGERGRKSFLIRRNDGDGHVADGHAPTNEKVYWWITEPCQKAKIPKYETASQRFPIVLGKKEELTMAHCKRREKNYFGNSRIQGTTTGTYLLGFHRWMTLQGAKQWRDQPDEAIIEGVMEDILCFGKQDNYKVVVGRTFTPLRVVK